MMRGSGRCGDLAAGRGTWSRLSPGDTGDPQFCFSPFRTVECPAIGERTGQALGQDSGGDFDRPENPEDRRHPIAIGNGAYAAAPWAFGAG